MQNALLIALVVIFICISIAGLAVYTVFFAIHKSYFHKEVNLIKKYNELVNGLNGINIYKIQVLGSNDIGNKLDLDKYANLYQKLRQNSIVIKSNISVAEVELNAFNLKVAKKYITSIDNDLNKALADLKELNNAYVHYTQYGDAVQITFQNYLEIYETLLNFYEHNLEYYTSFTRINKLFFSIRKTITTISSLSIKFDYKRTVDTIIDLGKKLKTLANAIVLVFRFQVIDTYLKNTKDYNQKLVSQHYDEIATQDLQSLQNLITLFSHTYQQFTQHYKNLELGTANRLAIQAIAALNQINQFTYVHINTPALINIGVGEIKEQTDKIIVNKNEIIQSMKDLKQYFVLEPSIIESFDVIEKNVNRICQLNNAANHVNYKTHTEKIRAIKDLDAIGNEIVKNKNEIISSIEKIDDMLAKVIRTVTDLNDLYIYFWQLLSIVNQLVPSGPDQKEMLKIIKDNLKQLEDYSKRIVEDKQPNFDAIASEISSIIEQSQQIYKHMTTTIVIKEYASKLFVYANRYKSIPELKDKFANASKSFKDKNYNQCIDQLLNIVKLAKKRKN